MTFERGQIVWVDFNPQKGHEQAGRRPALVISPSAYNLVSNCMLVCPITSNLSPWPWKVVVEGSSQITGTVLVDQIKSIDVKALAVETSGEAVPSHVLDNIMARLATLVS